ncbi:hypothetical protein QL285_031235 [Trifolium repens]|nr:hypothetical protein QL285_031235 [Trifolium repens]
MQSLLPIELLSSIGSGECIEHVLMLQVHGSIHHEGKNSTRGVEKAVSNSYGGDPGLGPPERWGPGLLQKKAPFNVTARRPATQMLKPRCSLPA